MKGLTHWSSWPAQVWLSRFGCLERKVNINKHFKIIHYYYHHFYGGWSNSHHSYIMYKLLLSHLSKINVHDSLSKEWWLTFLMSWLVGVVHCIGVSCSPTAEPVATPDAPGELILWCRRTGERLTRTCWRIYTCMSSISHTLPTPPTPPPQKMSDRCKMQNSRKFLAFHTIWEGPRCNRYCISTLYQSHFCTRLALPLALECLFAEV